MKKPKLFLVAALLISGSFITFKSVNTNSCMRGTPYYGLTTSLSKTDLTSEGETSEQKKFKRFKHTEDAMKEFGKYVPLPKEEPYFTKCTFGEVTYAADGEPVQFTHYVMKREIEVDVQKGFGGNWDYEQDLSSWGRYYYRVSKVPFTHSLKESGAEDVKTILLNDGVEALLWRNLIEWEDDKFYYQFQLTGFDETALTFYANSSRVNLSSVPIWVHGIR